MGEREQIPHLLTIAIHTVKIGYEYSYQIHRQPKREGERKRLDQYLIEEEMHRK
jgi:hypothetical protein